MAPNLRTGRSCSAPARTRSNGITSTPGSLSRTASSRASTAHCAMSCSTRNCSTAWLTPAGSWPSGVTTTTMFGLTRRWEIERLHKRVGRSCKMIASRPTRLRRRACRNIQPQDFRYERGTAGGQVTMKCPIRRLKAARQSAPCPCHAAIIGTEASTGRFLRVSSSNRSRAKPPPARYLNSEMPSEMRCPASRLPNAPTTSPQPDMNQSDRILFWPPHGTSGTASW